MFRLWNNAEGVEATPTPSNVVPASLFIQVRMWRAEFRNMSLPVFLDAIVKNAIEGPTSLAPLEAQMRQRMLMVVARERGVTKKQIDALFEAGRYDHYAL